MRRGKHDPQHGQHERHPSSLPMIRRRSSALLNARLAIAGGKPPAGWPG
jgi:hypothetical protein